MLPSQIVAIVVLSVSVVFLFVAMWLVRSITHPKGPSLDLSKMDSKQFQKLFHQQADKSLKRKDRELA